MMFIVIPVIIIRHEAPVPHRFMVIKMMRMMMMMVIRGPTGRRMKNPLKGKKRFFLSQSLIRFNFMPNIWLVEQTEDALHDFSLLSAKQIS